MTSAFEDFMKRYHATGSEKADGYYRSMFVGMDTVEKAKAFDLLQSELPFSVEWLFFLNPERAANVVKLEEQRVRGDGFRHTYMLQEQLLKHTGDLAYQQHMMEDYPIYTDNLKPFVINAIGRSAANEAALNFLRQIVLVEAHGSAVARAARRFLMSQRSPTTRI